VLVVLLVLRQLGLAVQLTSLSFLGSDTISGIELANHYYYEEMAGVQHPSF